MNQKCTVNSLDASLYFSPGSADCSAERKQMGRQGELLVIIPSLWEQVP